MSLLASTFCYAEGLLETPVDLNLPSFETVKKFNREQLELYILGMRSAIDEIEAMQIEDGVDYASAPTWNLNFFSEAEAASNDQKQCIYGGWVRTRNTAGKCPRPDKGGCTGPNFRCPVIYGGKCVGYQHYATRACVRSAQGADAISADLLSDSTGNSQRKWEAYTKQIQTYCGRGSSRRFCQTLQRRVREIRDVSGVAEFVPVPNYETVPAPPGTPNAGPGLTLKNPNSDGDSNACYSELLVQTTRCNGGALKMAMPADIAYRAFCMSDKTLLESNIAPIRARAEAQIKCLKNQAARSGGDKYYRRAVQDQVKLAAQIRQQIERCYQFVKKGSHIPSKHLGTLRFPDDTSQPVEVTSISPPQTVTLQAGYFAASINLQKTSGRFCDYDLAGVPAAPTPVVPPPPVAEAPRAANVPVPASVPLPSSVPVVKVTIPTVPAAAPAGTVRTSDQ